MIARSTKRATPLRLKYGFNALPIIFCSLDADGNGAEEMMPVVTVFEQEGASISRLEFSNPTIKPLTLQENSTISRAPWGN